MFNALPSFPAHFPPLDLGKEDRMPANGRQSNCVETASREKDGDLEYYPRAMFREQP